MKTRLLVVGFALLALGSTAARAGIADKGVPLLAGQKAVAVYSVSGVVTAGGLGTYFSCTSVAFASIQVSVEVFDDTGAVACNDASAVSVSVPPGGTVMFATQNLSASFPSAHVLTSGPVLIGAGSARILSTSKSIICTAFLADAYSSPPTSMVPLTIVYRTKQRGN